MYLNASANKLASTTAMSVQQALIILGEKIGIAEQQRAMHLFETLQTQMLTFEQLDNIVKESFKEKDMAVLEAAFNEMDHGK